MTDNKEVFKKRKKRQTIVSICAICTVILSSVVGFKTVALAIVIGLVIFSRFNWKCPKCNKYLGRGSNPKHCTHCGEELN